MWLGCLWLWKIEGCYCRQGEGWLWHRPWMVVMAIKDEREEREKEKEKQDQIIKKKKERETRQQPNLKHSQLPIADKKKNIE